MITVTIGSELRRFEDVSEQWINQQIHRRRQDNVASCVAVSINLPPLNMVLTTPGCKGGGGGRPPNEREKQIFDLWHRLGLNDERFTGANVVAFLKQLRRGT